MRSTTLLIAIPNHILTTGDTSRVMCFIISTHTFICCHTVRADVVRMFRMLPLDKRRKFRRYFTSLRIEHDCALDAKLKTWVGQDTDEAEREQEGEGEGGHENEEDNQEKEEERGDGGKVDNDEGKRGGAGTTDGVDSRHRAAGNTATPTLDNATQGPAQAESTKLTMSNFRTFRDSGISGESSVVLGGGIGGEEYDASAAASGDNTDEVREVDRGSGGGGTCGLAVPISPSGASVCASASDSLSYRETARKTVRGESRSLVGLLAQYMFSFVFYVLFSFFIFVLFFFSFFLFWSFFSLF